MLSGEGNENGEKTTIGVGAKKHELCTCSTLFWFCRCFAWLQRETSRNFLVTRSLEEMSCAFFGSLFFLCHSFSPLHWWPLAFLMLSPPLLQNFHVVLPTKIYLLCFFISRSRFLSPFLSLSFAGMPPTHFSLYFSVFLLLGYIPDLWAWQLI